MKKDKSKAFEFDKRNFSQVLWAILIGLVSVYASNTEAFNLIIAKYTTPEMFVFISGVLAYSIKKFLTDYSK